MKDPTATPLAMWQVQEFSDVFADALVQNDDGQVMFLSCYGRDTAIQQMMAAFQLPVTSGGVDWIRLRRVGGLAGDTAKALIGDPRRLTKLTGKLPRRNLFGNLAHVFIFDECLVQTDRGRSSGWVLSADRDQEAHRAEVWQMVRQLSTVPLLDHWHEPLFTYLDEGTVTTFDERSPWKPLGDIQASRITIDQDRFVESVSALVIRRALTRAPDPEALAA